jgi:hypothetical protein
MPSYGNTTIWALRKLLGTSNANDIDAGIAALADDVDTKLTPASAGTLAVRPPSTVGSPSGKAGRTYRTTDTNEVFRDTGTGWETVLTSAQVVALGLTADGVVRRGKSIISTSQSSSNAAYVFLTTPDRVQNIVLPTDGLIMIAYQALWQESVSNSARAAIVIGSNQLKVVGGPPAGQAASILAGTVNVDAALTTFPGGLQGSGTATSMANATTGQIVGIPSTGGGACAVFAAAGTYDIGVQFQALSGGTVTVKDRRLWVWTIGF